MANEVMSVEQGYYMPAQGGGAGTPRKIILFGLTELLLNTTLTNTGSSTTQPSTVKLAWFLPAGTTTISVAVNYNATIDLTGARPYAKLYADSGMGIAADVTGIAPAGAGSQTITLTFAATSADGYAVVDLVVPESGNQVAVTWTPAIQPGQSASQAPGSGSGNGGAPIKGSVRTLSSASIG